ncbi:MAG TPA: SGNH/GDSL hydrolase family protein [Blastocatellia bacterium]|nr:SGNH/GDSL hydrolase family protein [Blastocatellia bacterium]
MSGVLALLLLVASPVPNMRVLFVGNSLTYFNDVPALVERIGRANGRRIDTTMIAYPNYALEDHIARGNAPKAIAKGGWDVVVFQQGPSASPEFRDNLIEYSTRFADMIRQAGGRPAVYQVWAARNRSFDFDRVRESYRIAARKSGSMLMPVGDARRDAMVRDPSIDLFGPDGFHPSMDGSVLAALVIYQRLTGEAPAKLPDFDVPRAELEELRASAIAACREADAAR